MSETANGTYIVEYTVTISGLYEIKVSLGEQPIKGSPFAMQALPADARASHSVAFGRNGSMQVVRARVRVGVRVRVSLPREKNL